MKLRYFVLLCLLVLALAVVPYSAIIKPPEFEFDISVSPGTLFLEGSGWPSLGEVKCIVAVAPTKGLVQPVSLTLTGFPTEPPASYSYTFSPTSSVPPFSSTLIITGVEFDRRPPMKLTVVGTGGGKMNSAPIVIVIHVDDA